MVEIAANSLLGLTSTESVLKLFELKSISSSYFKNDKSVGSVQKSFDAMFNTYSLGKYENSYRWLGGILL
jgi:hypothetical protein